MAHTIMRGVAVAKEPAPKHLTITIDFDLQTEGSTVHYQRARAAYEAAVEAAIWEATRVLPPDSIKEITSEVDWSYRWTRESDVQFRRPDLVDDEIEDITDEDFRVGGRGLILPKQRRAPAPSSFFDVVPTSASRPSSRLGDHGVKAEWRDSPTPIAAAHAGLH
ncbi:hypothetical protein ABZV15_08090 [Streptomyces sp. NPDC005246]|uniref:hypothetical protein n=1 Tax=Streptomyces sp. NPDC005246 TaxID=3156716 RepID=UPI0033BE637E